MIEERHPSMDFSRARALMVEQQLKHRGISNPAVLKAFLQVQRHLFVDPALWYQAYEDHPLGIGEGQTISQPFMVAIMTECLAPQQHEKILEIGTGSGYQTAILAELCKEVWTIERIPGLLDVAKERLDSFGYQNIHYQVGDGSKGFPESYPFDGIIVTAAAPSVPEPLKQQLGLHGRLVIPVGDMYWQELLLITRTESGFKQENKGSCVFVRLIGEHGWRG